MKKIPTMFKRDESAKGRPVISEIKPECQWVLDGEGQATRKIDGSNVKIANGVLWKRQKPKEGDYDEASYVMASPSDPSDQYLLDAFFSTKSRRENLGLNLRLQDGIYEAYGPKIQGNPENIETRELVRVVPPCPSLFIAVPRDFDGLREYLTRHDFEGIVFHHRDGRMAKIKGRDFGITR